MSGVENYSPSPSWKESKNSRTSKCCKCFISYPFVSRRLKFKKWENVRKLRPWVEGKLFKTDLEHGAAHLKDKLNFFHGHSHEFGWHFKDSDLIRWFDVKHDILEPADEEETHFSRKRTFQYLKHLTQNLLRWRQSFNFQNNSLLVQSLRSIFDFTSVHVFFSLLLLGSRFSIFHLNKSKN